MKSIHRKQAVYRGARSAWLLMLLALAQPAQAWVLNLSAATRRVYLQVGVGTYQANVATVNLVSVTVPANQIGTGVVQPMISNSSQATSPYDNFALCSPPQQVYVGATYQRSNAGNGPATALMQVSSPANLVNAAGDTIPFTQISWPSFQPAPSPAACKRSPRSQPTAWLRTAMFSAMPIRKRAPRAPTTAG
jgi:hypothetical protein